MTLAQLALAVTRYSFTPGLCLLFGHESIIICYLLLHLQLPKRLQYYCTTIAQFTPPPDPPLYAVHYTILVMAISYKGQSRPSSSLRAPRMARHEGERRWEVVDPEFGQPRAVVVLVW